MSANRRSFLRTLSLSMAGLGLQGCMMHYKEGNLPSKVLPVRYEEKTRPEILASAERVSLSTNKFDVKELELSYNEEGIGRKTNFTYYDDKTREKSPLVLILSLGIEGLSFEPGIASYFAENGFSSAFVNGHLFDKKFRRVEYLDEYVSSGVAHARRVLDWAVRQKDIAGDKIGAFGFSIAGLKGLELMAEDERVRASVFGMIGEDIRTMVMQSKNDKVLTFLDDFSKRTELGRGEIDYGLSRLKCDPRNFVDKIDPSRMLFFLAKRDSFVPYQDGISFWEKIGKSEKYDFSFGHLAYLLFAEEIKRRSLAFYKEKFYGKLA